MSEIEKLLKPFFRREFGPELLDKEARLAEFKRLAAGHLPADYEEFLRLYGRAVSLEDNHILAIDPPRSRQEGRFTYIGPNPPIEILYGFQENYYDLIKELEVFRDQIPPGLIVIGGDIMGNKVCMDVAGPNPNMIWHWFHEGEESFDENGNPGYANMFRLAYSFTDLLQRLRPGDYEDPSEPKPAPASSEAKICYVAPGFLEEIRQWNEQEEKRRNGEETKE